MATHGDPKTRSAAEILLPNKPAQISCNLEQNGPLSVLEKGVWFTQNDCAVKALVAAMASLFAVVALMLGCSAVDYLGEDEKCVVVVIGATFDFVVGFSHVLWLLLWVGLS